MNNRPKVLSVVIIVIVMASMLACNIPFIQISIGNTATPAVAEPVVLSPEPAPTEQTTDLGMTDLPPTNPNLRIYDSGVINFSYDISVFMDVDAQTIAAVPPDPNAMPFSVTPLHTELLLKGYAVSNHFHTPRIFIYPAEDYASMLDFVDQDINALKLIIANNSSEGTSNLPLLPPMNAAQIFHSNFKHLEFFNGSGIRYVTMYSQGIYPVNNFMVFYTFQGITSDGKTYISMILPVNNPALPANGDNPPGGETWESFSSKYQTYLANSVSQLNASPDDSFTPDLALLDEMVQSVTLK